MIAVLLAVVFIAGCATGVFAAVITHDCRPTTLREWIEWRWP